MPAPVRVKRRIFRTQSRRTTNEPRAASGVGLVVS